MVITLSRWTAAQVDDRGPELAALLKEVVDGGASIGFLPPLDTRTAHEFWQSLIAPIANGKRIILVAEEAGAVLGTVQLDLDQPENGAHRAEVKKLMVGLSARRRGLARDLMLAIESEARNYQRSLLVLDTCVGSHAEGLYRSLGWLAAGQIPNFARLSPTGFCTTLYMYRDVPI